MPCSEPATTVQVHTRELQFINKYNTVWQTLSAGPASWQENHAITKSYTILQQVQLY